MDGAGSPVSAGWFSFGRDAGAHLIAIQFPLANSPDLNPIENVWSFSDSRLADTDPGTLEKFDAFKERVRNAVAWLPGPQNKLPTFYGQYV